MKKLAEAIVRLRWPIVVVVLVLTIFFSFQIKDIRLNSDIISSLPDDDSISVLFKDVGKKYGGNTMGMIVLQSDSIFSKPVLEDIRQITDTLKIMQGVSTVTSLTNIIDIKGSEGGIEIGQLVDEYNLPDTKAKLDALKSRVFLKDMYKGTIVSKDGTSTLIMFTLQEDADQQVVAKAIKDKIEALHLPEKLYFGGLPMIMNDIAGLMMTDLRYLLPITFLIIAFILLISFHSVRGVLLPLLSSGIAIVWVLGLMQLLGYELTLVSDNIPIILLAIGSAYTIHVVNQINECKERDRRKALIIALAYIITPVFLSGITTIFGFTSFIFGAYLTIIRDFGIFTSLGVLFALIMSVVFVPALISVFSIYRNPEKLKKIKIPEKTLMGKFLLLPLSNITLKNPILISYFWIMLIIIGIVGIFNIKTSVNMADYFRKNNPMRVSEDIMQKQFGGSQPVFVVVKGDMQSPGVLKTMIKTENFMKENPKIDNTQSVADLIEEMNDIMGEGKRIPDEKNKIEQLWFLLDGQDIMPQLVSDNLDEGVIQTRFASYDTEEMEDFVISMNRFIKENNTKDCRIELTGIPSVYVKLNHSLINSQYRSLTIAIILVIFIVSVILRSFLKGIYAALPIIATIIILFGFMGFSGISLNVATVLVASVAL
ncbi:MAG: MMPL family transporter, partial [Bacteroidales bacterium]|nr:MMPL family transporter [Bacteroidales bacterium]